MDVQRKFSDIDSRLVCNGLHGVMSQRAYAEEQGLSEYPHRIASVSLDDSARVCTVRANDGETLHIPYAAFEALSRANVPAPHEDIAQYRDMLQAMDTAQDLADYRDMMASHKRGPVGDMADKLRGPQWTDAHGAKHSVMFYRKPLCWQAVEHADGEIWLIHEMPCYLPFVCDTPTGALWALRGIVAQYMPHAARCTRDH